MEEDGTRTRIFVGGLGENVKEADMEQIFRDSLGKIDAIDFVRTKGRCFAYCDFIPSSSKSLPKIFSTYNGCVWKGGKLKLEKAKEHYLVRMKKEWEEAKLVTTAPTKEIEPIASLPISKKDPKWEKMQLHIFFPKLQKVKALPFVGTGKHKYSFQRIKVPPFPINFCDCDEHYVPHTAKGKYVSESKKESAGITEEELNVMNSVMNKIIYKESNSKAGSEFSEIFKGDASPTTITDENEATDEEDEDNLIINVVANGSKKKILSGTHEKEPKAQQLQFSKDGPLDTVNTKKREVPPHNKKRKIITRHNNTVSETNGVLSRNPKRRDTRPPDAADILLDHETPPELHCDSKSAPAWSQKSSWKQLVGNEGNSLFSISSVLPGNGSGSRKQGTTDGKYGTKSGQTKEQRGQVIEETHPILNAATTKEATEETRAVSYENETFAEETLSANCSRDEEPAKNFQASNTVKDEEHAEEPKPSNVLKSEHVAEETRPSATFGNSGRGVAWFHQSSWTELISETDNSFSISQIIPSNATTSAQDEIPKINEQQISITADNKNIPEAVKPISDMVPEKNEHSAPEKTVQDTILPGTCSFIRSAASLKEWANTKAAVTRSAKRKTREDLNLQLILSDPLVIFGGVFKNSIPSKVFYLI